MSLARLDDKVAIEAFLRRDPRLHVYEIADLDPVFWPFTSWFGWREGTELAAVAVLYDGGSVPCLLLFGPPADRTPGRLAEALFAGLPARFDAHLSPGLVQTFAPARVRSRGAHLKMALSAGAAPADDPGVLSLGPAHVDELETLYAHAYPGHWFDPRMLETGAYVGIRDGRRLVSVAGVHALSRAGRVAALGNITTHPGARGRGLARRTTSALCHRLRADVDTIGLNVHADNATAIRVYEGLGFERVARYEEVEVTRGA